MPPKSKEVVEKVNFGRVKNNLKMGIVGLPNVGKSSLFNLLTSQSAAAENFPFCTIEPNEARCPVPDARYDYLCNLWKPPSTQPAYLQITDIAGLIKGASDGAGLGNNFLSHIQAVDGIFHVVRVFDDQGVIHVDDSIDPVRDLETIQSELCKKDLEYVSKGVQAEETAVRKSGGKYKLSPMFISTMERVKTMLQDNIPIRSGQWTPAEVELINDKTNCITTKPMVYLINMSQGDFVRKKNKWLLKIHNWINEHGGGVMIPFSIEFEQALWDLRAEPDKQADLLKELGVVSSLPKMITTGYKELNLIYFFTTGEKEVRAWTVYAGALAPDAAGVIHTDFTKGFIKAEVVSYEDYAQVNEKSMAAVKALGKYKIEGKTYVVKDGDIIHFQIGTITAPKKK